MNEPQWAIKGRVGTSQLRQIHTLLIYGRDVVDGLSPIYC